MSTKRKKITVAIDAAIADMAGYDSTSIAFTDGIPTVDDGLAFYISQLESIETRIYETKYPAITYQDFIPIDMSDPEFVDSVSYYSYDTVTAGKFIGASAKDLPESDVNAAKTTVPVYYGGNQYSYSLDELRKSQATNMSLDVTKAKASRRGFEEHAQQVAFFGDTLRGLEGLFNNSNIQDSTVTIDFSTATGQAMVTALNAPLKEVWTNSKETHVPGDIVIPSVIFEVISEKRMADGTDTTVLEFFRTNNLFTSLTGQPLNIKQSLHLNDAGAGSVPRLMAYEKNEENLFMKMPIAWRQIAPQPVGLSVTVPAEYKFGPCSFRYPGSAAYVDIV